MIEFRSGGRKVGSDRFFENLKQKALDTAFEALEKRAHGAAASIVDPATGKHADVFVRRRGNAGVVISTKGSPTFARELEKRLGVERGTIKSMTEQPAMLAVYLAHASEDH